MVIQVKCIFRRHRSIRHPSQSDLCSGLPDRQPRLGMWHRGSLTLFCSSCRYTIRRWHVPILGVDCNSNPRHKQSLSNPAPRSRGIPKHLAPYIFSKQYPKHPHWRADATFLSNSTLKYKVQARRH